MKHPVNNCNRLAQIMHTSLGQTCAKLYTLFKTDLREIQIIVYPVLEREDVNHTLSSGTSPYRPYKGVPPPPPGHFRYIKFHTWLRAVLREQTKEITLGLHRRPKLRGSSLDFEYIYKRMYENEQSTS